MASTDEEINNVNVNITKLPVCVNDITSNLSWLTSLLRACDVITNNSTITSVETCIVGADKGLSSNVTKVVLHFNIEHESNTKSIVIKELTDNLFGGTFCKEVFAYNNILQNPCNQLKNSQKDNTNNDNNIINKKMVKLESCIKPVDGIMRWPNCYFANEDASSKQRVLILEDLGLISNGQWLSNDGLDTSASAKQNALLVTALAQFHAQTWNDTEIIAKYKEISGNLEQVKALQAYLEPVWSAMKLNNAYSNDLTALSTSADQLDIKFKETIAKYDKLVDHILCGSYLSIVQGDVHKGNMMIENNSKVIIYDWQFCSIGNPLQDISYFLNMSVPSIASDEQKVKELIQLYLNSLQASNSNIQETVDSLFEEYKLTCLYLFFTAPLLVSAFENSNNRAGLLIALRFANSLHKSVLNFNPSI